MKITKHIGLLLTGIWLLLNGLTSLAHFSVPAVVMALLAVVGGVLLIIDR